MTSERKYPVNWYAIIYGSVVIIAGLVAGYLSVGSTAFKYFASSSWEQVPVDIS